MACRNLDFTRELFHINSARTTMGDGMINSAPLRVIAHIRLGVSTFQRTEMPVGHFVQRLKHKIMKKLSKMKRSSSFTKEYYRLQHKFSTPYQQNNWLLEHKERLLPFLGNSVLEVGCGNGKFLYSIAGQVDRAVGIDWAASPTTEITPKNVVFKQADALSFDFSKEKSDLICSADVLEHFPANVIPRLIKNMQAGAKYNFHVIACYDDGHSHVTVQPADWWLERFRSISSDYRIEQPVQQNEAAQRATCIITNLPYRE